MLLQRTARLCHYLFVKDFRILKFMFAIMASYLIIETFYTFLILKPTYTSEEKRQMNVEDFPEIIFCPQPFFDLDALKSRGYSGPENYYKGLTNIRSLTQMGWAGNKSEDVKTVSAKISTLKTINDCPLKGFFWFSSGVFMKHAKSKYAFTKVLHPYHIC